MTSKYIKFIFLLLSIFLLTSCALAPYDSLQISYFDNYYPGHIKQTAHKGNYSVAIDADIVIPEELPTHYYETTHFDYNANGFIEYIKNSFFNITDLKTESSPDHIVYFEKKDGTLLKSLEVYNDTNLIKYHTYNKDYSDAAMVSFSELNSDSSDYSSKTEIAGGLLNELEIDDYRPVLVEKYKGQNDSGNYYRVTYKRYVNEIPVFSEGKTTYEGITLPKDKLVFEIAEDNSIISFEFYLSRLQNEELLESKIIDIDTAINTFENHGIAQLSGDLRSQSVTVVKIELQFMHVIYKDKHTFSLIPVWNFVCSCTGGSEITHKEIQVNALDASLIE